MEPWYATSRRTARVENNLSLQIKGTHCAAIFLATTILMSIVPGIAGDNGTVQQLGCVFDLITKTGCQQGTENVLIPACPAPNCNAQSATKDVFFAHPFLGKPNVTSSIYAPELGIDERSWTILAGGSATTWAAQPAAVTEIFGNTVHEWAMLWNSDDNLTCSLVVNVINPGFAGAILKVQQSPDGVTWGDFQNANGNVAISASGIQVNTWAGLGNGGLGTSSGGGPFFRVVGSGGNGIVSPSFGNIYFECWWNTIFLQAYAEVNTNADFFLGASILMPSNLNPQGVTIHWTATYP